MVVQNRSEYCAIKLFLLSTNITHVQHSRGCPLELHQTTELIVVVSSGMCHRITVQLSASPACLEACGVLFFASIGLLTSQKCV